MDQILFLIFAAIAVVCGVNLVLQNHPISSALSLIGVMGALAALYLLLGAEFIAAAQLIVYAGAIMVLFIFVIMLLNAGGETSRRGSPVPGALGGLLLVFLLVPLAYFVQRWIPDNPIVKFGAFQGGSALAIGRALFTTYLLPFEITSLLVLSAILFTLGVAGFIFRRSIITVFMSIELMLNAVNLTFVAFSYQFKAVNGHLFAFFVMVVAAAEAAVGLAIILTVFKNRNTLNIDDVSSMKD